MRLAVDFWKSKTTFASLSTIITTIVGAIQGRIDPFHAVLACLAVLHLPFLRDAWAKGIEDVLLALEGVAAGGAKADGGEAKP